MFLEVGENNTLDLLPPCEFVENVHILIHNAKSVGTIIGNCTNVQTSRAYLEYREEDGEYYLVLRTSVDIVCFLMAKFSPHALDEKVKLCVTSAKQFTIAGIDVFWDLTCDATLQLAFCVNTNKINRNIDEMLKESYESQVAPRLNKFFSNTFPDSCENSNNVQPFLGELGKMTSKWEVLENFEIREDLLNCQLMEYQKKTVKWMIEKEMRPEKIDLAEIFRSFQLVTPSPSNNCKSLYYFPILGVFSESDSFDTISAPRGGILADEMGLGKTVEMISLIVSHRKDKPSTMPRKSTSTQNPLDWDEYKAAKNAGKLNRSSAIYTITPKEMENKKSGNYRQCQKCGDMCDLDRCGWKSEFECEFWCPQCMETKTLLEVKTTLIVLPESLLVQWYNDISKHCSEDIKVMFYFGINKTGYLHPLEITKFDIILTTYSTLTTEMDFFDFQNRSGPRLVRLHKFSPTSLTHVKWWRLVCDEAQLVEGASNRAAQMCTKIESHHRWCMTSTPIVRSIADLGGLFRIIGLWPFNVEQFWQDYVIAEFFEMSEKKENLSNSLLLQIAGQVMRRNTKKMVEDQLQLPILVQIEKIAKFTKIEESQYRKQMDGFRKLVKSAIGGLSNETLLNSMAEKGKLLAAWGKLKETLISVGEHNDFVKRQNANEQVICKPKNAMVRLFSETKNSIKIFLNDAFKTLFIVLDLYWIKNDMEKVVKWHQEAVDIFLLIDDLNEYFENMMTKIECSTKSRKRSLKDDLNEGSSQKIARIKVDDEVKLKVEQRAEKAMVEMRENAMKPILIGTLEYARLFVRLEELGKTPEMAEKVTALMNKMGGKEELEKKLRGLIDRGSADVRNKFEAVKDGRHEIINKWKKDQHVEMKEMLKEMQKSSTSLLINKLMSSAKTKPMLMGMSFWPVFENDEQRFKDAEMQQKLVRYHIHRFAECMGICKQKTFDEISRGYKKSTSSQVLQKMCGYIDHLETLREELFSSYECLVETFVHKGKEDPLIPMFATETLNCNHMQVDSLKICVNETKRKKEKEELICRTCQVLHTLAHLRYAIGTGSYHGKMKSKTNESVDSFFSLVFEIERKRRPLFLDGVKQLSDFLEYIKRLRQTTVQVQSGCDTIIDYGNCLRELNETTMRTEMNYLIQLPRNRYNTNCSDEQLMKHEIDLQVEEHNVIDEVLKETCQDLRFMMKPYLPEEQEKEDNICPVCHSELDTIVVKFMCGHIYCESCYRGLCDTCRMKKCVRCVLCRKLFWSCDVILERKNVAGNLNSEVIPGMTLSVKLEAKIRLMKEIIEEDSEKILLFTTMEFGTPIWRFLTKVLQKAKLPLIEVTRNDYAKNISDFQSSTEPKILLFSLSMCTNGLNLTMANNIIFLDPPHPFSVVEQTIDKMHRFGQKREMKVYHMITEGSIDEEIRKVVKSGKEETDLTVGQLRQIFCVTG